MTPEERQLIDDLFDRLARLEANPRDQDAERAIAEGLKRAPHAAYALVQTALVQDEALKRADARIRELSVTAQPPEQQSSFLDTMRSALGSSRTSVPSVRSGAPSGPDPRWNQGGSMPNAGPVPGYAPPSGYGPAPGYGPTPGYGGGSFLGTAAATAAGAIGGALLLNSISSMFGHRGGSAFASTPSSSTPQSSPWDNSASNSDLARDAGVGDIGNTRQGVFDDQRSAGLLNDPDDDDPTGGGDFDDDRGGDFGDFGGGTDSA
jgi:hypothetical protein